MVSRNSGSTVQKLSICSSRISRSASTNGWRPRFGLVRSWRRATTSSLSTRSAGCQYAARMAHYRALLSAFIEAPDDNAALAAADQLGLKMVADNGVVVGHVEMVGEVVENGWEITRVTHA